jgi:hypothetical protein
MSRTPRRHSFVIASILVVTVASVALALPAAASVRQAIGPQLPLVVVVLGTLTGVWQLVTGVVAAVRNGGIGASAAVPLSLGVSACCMALAFLPPAPHSAPRLLPVFGAAFFAIAAAALQRRGSTRPDF